MYESHFVALLGRLMANESPDTRVRLIAQGPDLWRVQVLFEDGLEEMIPQKLREIKVDLAKSFGVPDNLLEYMQMLSKRRTKNGLLVEIQIRKQPIPFGAPVIRYLPVKGPSGLEYSDMRIEADIFPIDSFGHPTSRRMIEGLLKADCVDLSLVDWRLLDEKLREIRETGELQRSITIGSGRIPDAGLNSVITFPVQRGHDEFAATAWMGLRFVKLGEALVEASSAVSGSKHGKNVFGREIETPKPIQTRLEAGTGCKLSAMGNRITSTQEGLLMLERQYQDRKAKDSMSACPAKIIASIIEPEIREGDQVWNLKLLVPTVIRGTVRSGSYIQANSHLLIEGDIESKSQIDCTGRLRIVGTVADANLSAKEHLCIVGSVSNSFISGDLTVQIDGDALQCTIYAREIVASNLTGGIAEALSQSMIQKSPDNTTDAIQINQRKFLETLQKEGAIAIQDLQEQMSIVNDIFGPEIVQKVSEENIQLMLLRWLRQQKSRNLSGFSFREVQDFRTILSVVPIIRNQLAALGAELRDISVRLDLPAGFDPDNAAGAL
jgi:cytoskeletal protein CcmA (bactofilin family)